MRKIFTLAILLVTRGVVAHEPLLEQPEFDTDLPTTEDISRAPKDQAEVISLTGDKLSPQNQKFVKDLIKELDINYDITLVQPSAYVKRISPQFAYEAVFLAEYQTLFINEEWLNRLSEPEKRFLIGKNLLKIKNQLQYFKRAKKQFLIKGLFVLGELTSLLMIYRYLGRTETFKGPGWWNRLQKLGISLIPSFLFEVFIHYPMAKKSEEKMLFDDAKYAVETLDCHEGALQLYRRLKEELTPDAQTSYWYYYYKGLEKLIPYLESLKPQKA